MYLEEIVGRDILESAELECKARLNRNDVEGWLKSVAGFANAQGGHLYIGVEDKSNKLIGFTRAQADSERAPSNCCALVEEPHRKVLGKVVAMVGPFRVVHSLSG